MELLRYAVFAIFLAAALVALASWAVRTRQVNPFSTFGRTLRNLSDPVIDPVERWVLKRGGNPQNAGWWLFGFALVGGIVVLTVTGWLVGQFRMVSNINTPRGILRTVIYYAGQVVIISLIVRVIGSWFGAGRFNRWIGWSYKLTDWIVEPLRRVIPPLGMIDISPLVAWLIIHLGLRLILGFI